MRRTQLLCFAMALLALPSLAVAGSQSVLPDSFSPLSFTDTIKVGEKTSVDKEFQIAARNANTPVDIFFVFDTSGSFQSRFGHTDWTNTVAPGLISQAVASMGGRFNDVQFAVARYEDFPSSPWGTPPGDSPYTLVQGFTSNTTTTLASLTTGIATTGTGGDSPESNLHALGNAANEATWRTDSVKMVIWLGDAPGHVPGEMGWDGSSVVLYPGAFDTSGVIGAMNSDTVVGNADDMMVQAFDFGGLDAQVKDFLNNVVDSQQATAITGGSGGNLYSVSGGTIPNELADFYAKYQTALDTAFAQYILGLDTSAVPAGLGFTVTPVSVTGDRTAAVSGGGMYHTHILKLEFTGLTPGVYTFPIYGMLDGRILGTEFDHITVLRNGDQPPPWIPEPSTFALLGLGLVGVGVAARRRKKK